MITALVVFHVTCGTVYLGALVGLCAGAPILAVLDWAHRWHLVALAGIAAALAGLGLFGARSRRWNAHIVGTGGSSIVMLAAFYVDNGPRLPLWNQLPPIVFWFLPIVVGWPVLWRALHRRRAPHRQRPGIREMA